MSLPQLSAISPGSCDHCGASTPDGAPICERCAETHVGTGLRSSEGMDRATLTRRLAWILGDRWAAMLVGRAVPIAEREDENLQVVVGTAISLGLDLMAEDARG